MSDLKYALGEKIRNYRKGRGYSQEELANLANLHTVYIGQLERGEKSPTIDSLEGIVEALGISFEELFRHIRPVPDSQESVVISEIISKVQGRSIQEQQVINKMIDLMIEWKEVK
ncbi:helix-turn-helix transcriptional regulator [Paenibacillus sp. FSL L8-0333]|uniref:helix-turn-helix domain-containing protein n=1 Tax=unclassified Paenibacillus TaxID=185978 RepID=UPI0030CD6CA2